MIYATTNYADEYLGARLNGGAWLTAALAVQSEALQSASDLMDAYAAENGGWKTAYRSDNTLPDAIKRVCCEEACALLDAAAEQRRALIRAGVRSASIGGASESYADSVQSGEVSLRCASSRGRLLPYLKGKKRVVGVL